MGNSNTKAQRVSGASTAVTDLTSGHDRTRAGETVPVVICGGGPVGLTLALELAAWEVPVVLIERHRHPTPFPKGRALGIRAMEIFRQLGLEDEIASVGLAQPETTDHFYGETLAADLFKRVSDVSSDGSAPVSPTFPVGCSQDALESVLRHHVDRNPLIDVRLGKQVVSAGVGASGAVVWTSGHQRPIETDWLIAADGACSTVRDLVGIPIETFGPPCDSVNILFEADLGAVVADRSSLVYTLSNDRQHATLLTVDGRHRWLCNVIRPDQRTITKKWCRDQVDSALGSDDLRVRVVAARRFNSTASIADRYRQDRVVLVGDAAHAPAPHGGLGMDCGIADAHNLAWKLAMVIRHGWNEDVIDTYETERRPIGERTVQESAARLQAALVNQATDRTRRGKATDKTRDGLALCSEHRSRSVHPDIETHRLEHGTLGTSEPPRPGCRAPHAWLADRRSTLDLFGPHFTMLYSHQPPKAPAALATAPMTRIDIDQFVDPSHDIRRAYGLSEDAAVVVRPDGHVMWRSDSAAPV